MIKAYLLLITYMHSDEQIVMRTSEGAVIAEEGNQYLLLEAGNRLIDENIIGSYQLVETSGSPVFNMRRHLASEDAE